MLKINGSSFTDSGLEAVTPVAELCVGEKIYTTTKIF